MKWLILPACAALMFSVGCNRCYTCTGQTDFGPVEKEVCGKKSNIGPLIDHLESDTANPWECEKN